MAPLTPAQSSSPAAGGSAWSNKTAPRPPANRTATVYARAEGMSNINSSASAPAVTQADGAPDGKRGASHVSHESTGCGHVISSASGNPSHTSYLEDHVARMQAEIERTTRRLEIEKRRLHELGESSRKAQHEFYDKRLRYSFNKAGAQAERLKAENNVLLLENRLSQALCKLNSGNDDINKLKALIDKHRKDRLAMEKVYRHVHRELAHHTEHLNQVKEKVTELQEWEQQSMKRLDELNKAKEQEREAFKQHCLTMQKELREQDRLIKEFDIRAHRESSMQRTQMKGSPYSVAEEEHSFNPESLMKLIFKTALLNAVHRHNIRQYKNKISVFEKAMESIKTSTGISDAEEIVSIFSQLEERNYSVMTYVNNINVELESLESKTRQLEMHMQQQAHHDATAQRLTDETLRDVAAQISNTKLATESKNALIQRQLQGLLQSHEMLEAMSNLIRSRWKGPCAFEEPPPREPGPFSAGGEKGDLLPMLWFTQKFFESHKELLCEARKDTGLLAAIAAAHAWVAAHTPAAANTHAAGNGSHAASGCSRAAAAVHVPGGRHASLAAPSVPSAGGNSVAPRSTETGSSSGSSTQGRVFAGGGAYLRGRSLPVTAATATATGGAAGGGPGGAAGRATGLNAGSPTTGNNSSGGGSLSHRKTIGLAASLGFRGGFRGHVVAATGEQRAASIDMQPHTRRHVTQSVNARKLSSHGDSTHQKRPLSAAAAPITARAAPSAAAVASSDDATTGTCDSGEAQRCATAESCTEAAAEGGIRTERAAHDKAASTSPTGDSGASQRSARARAEADSRSAPSDEEEDEDRDEDSSDEKSPIIGDVVPLSSEELRERTIHLFNRMRKKKAAAEGNTQPPALYLPEKRCLLASPGARGGVAPLSPLFPSVANSPLPGSPLPVAALPSCGLPQPVTPKEPACTATQAAAEEQAAPAAEVQEEVAGSKGTAETAESEKQPAGTECLAQSREVSVTEEAAVGLPTGQQQRQPERSKDGSAEIERSAGSVAETTSHSARRSSTTNSIKQGDRDGGLRKKNTVPHFLVQSGRTLLARQKEKQYFRTEPARRSGQGAALNATAQTKRSSGPPQLQQQQLRQQQFPQTPGTETKSRIFGGGTSFWRRGKIAKQPTDRSSVRQGERSSNELQANPPPLHQQQPQSERLRNVSSIAVGRGPTSSRKKSLSTQGSKEIHTQLQQQVISGKQVEQQENKQGGHQANQHGEAYPRTLPPTGWTKERRGGDEGQQELQLQEPQEQQRQEEQEKQQGGEERSQREQPQQVVQQLGRSQPQRANGSGEEQQAVVATIDSAAQEGQMCESHPNVTLKDPEQQYPQQDFHHLILQQHSELQDAECPANVHHEGAPSPVQTEDGLCSVQQEVRKEAAQQQYSTSQEMQQEVVVEGQQEQHERQQQDNCHKHQQPSQAMKESTGHKVEQQNSPVDSGDEIPSSLSVVLRQVPVNGEPQHEEVQEEQRHQQETRCSRESTTLPVRFAGLPEPLPGHTATTQAPDTLRRNGQEQTAAVVAEGGKQAAPPPGAEADTGHRAGPHSPRLNAIARAAGQRAAVPASSSSAGGGRGGGDNTRSGQLAISHNQVKRDSATVLAGLWERCEIFAAEEEAAARQEEQRRQREREAAEGGAGEGSVRERPPADNCIKTNEPQRRIEDDLYREHYRQRLQSDAATEAARLSLLHVMERALVQIEEGQQKEANEEKRLKGEQHQQPQSRAASPGSAGASFYPSPFSFLPENSGWNLGGSVSPSSSPSAGVAPAPAIAKASRSTPPPTASVLPAASLHGRAAASAAEADSVGGTPQAATEVGVGGGEEEAEQRCALAVQSKNVRTPELQEQYEHSTQQRDRSRSAGETATSGPLQTGPFANSAAHSSSSREAVSRCSSKADNSSSKYVCVSSICVTAINGGAVPRGGQKPDPAVTGRQSPRPRSSPAEHSGTVNPAPASALATSAGGSLGTVSLPTWFREHVGRPASPLSPNVVAAAFQAIRAATNSSSTVGADAETEGKQALVRSQRPVSEGGGIPKRFSAGAASVALRANSAGPSLISAGILVNSERSSTGPLGGSTGAGSPASAEVAPPTGRAAAAGHDPHADTLPHLPESTGGTPHAATAAAEEEAAAPFASLGTTRLSSPPGKAPQLSAPPTLNSEGGALATPSEACLSPTGGGEHASAGVAASQQVQQEEQQQQVIGSLRTGADLGGAASVVVDGGTEERVEDDGVLSYSSPFVSGGREGTQEGQLLLQQLQMTQPATSSKLTTTTTHPLEEASSTSPLHAAVVSHEPAAATTDLLMYNGGTANEKASAEVNACRDASAFPAASSTETRNDSSQHVDCGALTVGDMSGDGSGGSCSAFLIKKEAAAVSGASTGTTTVVSPSRSLFGAAAPPLESSYAGVLPFSNAGTRPPSQGGPLPGKAIDAVPLPRERVAAAAAALAASSGSSLGGLPSRSPCGSLTPAVTAAGTGAGAVSPATLALLRERSGVSSPAAYRNFAAAAPHAAGFSSVAATPTALEATRNESGDKWGQQGIYTCRRPSSPAAVVAALAAGAVVTVSSSPVVERLSRSRPPSAQLAVGTPASPAQRPSSPAAVAAAIAAGAVVTVSSSQMVGRLPGSRPLSAQQAVARLTSTAHTSKPVSAEDAQLQQEQGQQQASDTNKEKHQELQRQADAPTHPIEHQAPTEPYEENRHPQQQEHEQAGQQHQTHVVSNAAVSSSASAAPLQFPSDPSPAIPQLPAESHLSKTGGHSKQHTNEWRDVTAGDQALKGKYDETSSPRISSSSVPPDAASGGSSVRSPASVAAAVPSEEEDKKENHCAGVGSTAAEGENCVSGNAAAQSFIAARVSASFTAAEPSPATLGQSDVDSLQVEAAVEQDVLTPNELLMQQQQKFPYVEEDRWQMQQPHLRQSCGLPSGDGSAGGAWNERRGKVDSQQRAEQLQRGSDETEREDKAAQHSEIATLAHSSDAAGAAEPASGSNSVAPEKRAEQNSGPQRSDAAGAEEQGVAAEVRQVMQGANASRTSAETGNSEQHPAGAGTESSRMGAPGFTASASGAESRTAPNHVAQPTDLCQSGKSPGSGALSTPPVLDTSAIAASAGAFDNTAAPVHPRAASESPATDLSASPILPLHSMEDRRPASVGNKHVSLNLDQEQQQGQQQSQKQYEEEQHPPYPHWQQQRRSRQSQQSRRSHMSLLAPNRRSTRLSNAEMFQFSPPDLQPPEKESPPGTPPSAASSRPGTAANPAAQESGEEEAFSAFIEGNRFVARVSRVERLPPQQLNKIDEQLSDLR